MKFLTCLALGLSFLTLSASATADPETDIRRMLSFFVEQWNDGELESIKSTYHTDFTKVSADAVQTRDEHLADIEIVMAPDKDQGELTFSNIQIKLLGEDYAMAYGHRKLKFKDGSDLRATFSTVYVSTPFGWKALLTHD